jgi:formate dehydrogenase iron-sulfur subunit
MANGNAKGVLVDLTRCIGCRGCQVACKQWNERSVKKTEVYGNFTNPPMLNSECYTNIRYIEKQEVVRPVWSFIKNQCMHCKNPACVSACPVAALTKRADGPVVYNFDRCIGCRYCMIACPFQIPKYEWEKTLPAVRKCTFCADRISAGLIPACVKACPTQTMYYGDRGEIMVEAEKRLKDHPERYINHIYGKDEAGGTSWVYLSAEPFEDLGFNTKIPAVAMPDLTWASLAKIPYVVIGGAVVLSAIAYLRNRGNRSEGPGSPESKEEGRS